MAAFVDIGKLRHKIRIEERSNAPDGYGGTESTWVEQRTVWAQVKPISGVQKMEGMRRQSSISHEITLRASFKGNRRLTTLNRIVYDGRNFNVEAVRNLDERGRWLVATCSEGGSADPDGVAT